MRSTSLVLLPLLLSLSCASVDYSNAPYCAPLSELPALPDADCRADPATIAFRAQLQDAMSEYVGSLLVRVSLDEASRVRSVCSEDTQVRGSWKSRATLSERFGELAALAGGPQCLSARRLDLNRRSAALAEIKRSEAVCKTQYCSPFDATALLLYRVGRREPYVFGLPQVADPPAKSAAAILGECSKEIHFEDQFVCIEAAGWELLE